MKKGRGFGIGILVLIVVVAGALYVLLSSLDSIVASAIEKYGSQATQTPVRVSTVSIDLKSGTGSINELRIGNPPGFTAPNAFTLGGISTKIDVGSVTGDPVIIDEISVQTPHVVYEINGTGKSNIDVLKENVARASSSAESAPDSGTGSGPGLIVRKLVIDSGQIDARVAALPDKDMTAKLPRIELNNIGEKQGGATAAQISGQVLSALIRHVGPAVANLGLEKYLGKNLEDVKALGKNLGGELRGKAGESLGDAAKQGTEKLKNLLGN